MVAESASGRGSDGELFAAGVREGSLRHGADGQRGALQDSRGASGRWFNGIEIRNVLNRNGNFQIIQYSLLVRSFCSPLV